MSPRMKKFFSYYKPYLPLFIKVLLAAFLVAGLTLIFPLLVRHVTKDILEGPAPDALRQILLTGGVMIVLIAVQTLLTYYYDYYGHALGAMMESDMRQELFEHMQKLSFRFYDEQRTGQLMSRVTNDLLNLAELYHHGPEDYVIYAVKFIGAFIILLTINVPLTVAVFLFLPFIAWFGLHFNKKLRVIFRRSLERIADVNAQLEDTLGGIRVVKSFTNEEAEARKFAYENSRFLQSRKDIYWIESILWQGMGAFTMLITVTVVIYGGVNIVNARLDLADLLTFLLYIGALIEPVQKLNHITQQLMQGMTGFDRFMEIINTQPEIQDSPDAVEISRARGNVTFRGVSFRYGENQSYVLRDLNLEVPAGETIALVGSSGVGKTTLCSLIPRFYEVTEGEVLLDGVNVKNIKLHSLRRNVGVVQQDVYLFAGTVYENIRYGKPEATREEIIEAAKKANAHDFIMALPNDYDTDIGQRGVKLSGGQKQRISIARVFLKDPPVLIFDEATSSLDNESERVVQDSLEVLAQNRTTFVIAHRLSTIRNASRIVVLTDRGIEEQGNHEALLARNGTYARLYNMQFGGSPLKSLTNAHGD